MKLAFSSAAFSASCCKQTSGQDPAATAGTAATELRKGTLFEHKQTAAITDGKIRAEYPTCTH
jgi:hypothetical protein